MLGPLKRIRFLYCANNLLSVGSYNCAKNNILQLRTIRLGVSSKSDNEVQDEVEAKKKKKKTVPVPKITLINLDGSITITMLENAAKLAKHHNLKLIKTLDVDKSSRHIYKLVDHATYIKDIETTETKKNKSNKKSTKKFALSAKIEEHDLKTKLNSINKLLKKNHVIRIVLNYSEQNKKNKEEVLQYIKKNVEGVMSEERIRESDVIFTYLPPKEEKDNNEKSQIKSD